MARDSCRAVQGSSNLIGIYCARHSSSSNSIASNLRQFKSNNNKLRWADANALVRSRCPFGRNGGEGRGGERQNIEEFAAEDLSFFDLAAMLLRLWHLWHRLRLQSASASTSFANEALKMPMKRKLPQIVAIWQLAYIASQGCHTHTHNARKRKLLSSPDRAKACSNAAPARTRVGSKLACPPRFEFSHSHCHTSPLPSFSAPPCLSSSISLVLLCGSAAQTQNKFRRIRTKLFARPFAITTFNQITNTFRAKTILIARKNR